MTVSDQIDNIHSVTVSTGMYFLIFTDNKGMILNERSVSRNTALSTVFFDSGNVTLVVQTRLKTYIINKKLTNCFDVKITGISQSCIMSIFLHGAKFSNKILPQEKCVICNNFGAFSELSLLKR